MGVGIPRRDKLTTLNLITIAYRHFGAIRDAMTLTVHAVLIMNDEFAGSGNNDVHAIVSLHSANPDP